MSNPEPKIEVRREINVPPEHVIRNVRANIQRGLPQMQVHEPNEQLVLLILGGPSLPEFEDDIREKWKSGAALISTNATHDWLIERGLTPSLHMQLDARPFNARFVQNWQAGIKYFIASQSDPMVFDTLEGADVTIWHCMSKPNERRLLHKYYLGNFYEVPGGGTIGTRGLMLLRMLGFCNIEAYGFDSCYMGDDHHAYEQAENGSDPIGVTDIDGREFRCEPWMFEQAQDFLKMLEHVDEKFNLVVHGDGLIAHLIKTGSKLFREGD